MIVRRAASLVALLMVTLAGCGLLSLDNDDSQVRTLIEENRRSWEQNGPEEYRFTYDRTRGTPLRSDVEVTVRGERIDTVTVAGEGRVETSEFLTIGRLFDEIEHNFDRENRGPFEIEFNPKWSYPTMYAVEPILDNEGRRVVVTDFERLGPAEGTSLPPAP